MIVEWVHRIGVLLFLGLTLLPLSKNPRWWVRGADFPRSQLAVLGAALLGFSLWRVEADDALTWSLLAVNAAALGYQLWWIVPYTPFFRTEVAKASNGSAANRIRLMAVNVLMTNSQYHRLIEAVRQEHPDVLITLETNTAWERALRPLESEYPHRLRCPLENLYGMHVYSRLPLEDPRTQFLVQAEVPSMHFLVVLPSGQRICLHCLHPAPPSPTENPTSEERDAELVMVGRSVAKARFPAIVAGDLNDVAWSRTTRLFRKVSKLLDPRLGRGMFSTYHAQHWWCRWPVDHVFHSRDFSLVELKRLPFVGSDHFPVLIELEYGPASAENEEGPTATSEDEAKADEQMEAVQGSPHQVHRPGETPRHQRGP